MLTQRLGELKLPAGIDEGSSHGSRRSFIPNLVGQGVKTLMLHTLLVTRI